MSFLVAGSTRLFYEDSGAGPLALFIHGGGLDHSMWRSQLEGLAGVRRCVAIDLPGSGSSDAGPFDLAAAVAALGAGEVDLVGHSWGGHVVLAAWRSHEAGIRSIALLGVMFSADANLVTPLGPPSKGPPATRPVPVELQEVVVRSISVPLLVATGDRDQNTPPHLCRKLALSNPSAQWVEILNAGHLAPMEQPEQVNDALRSLW
jgi:3-oxoadipate enol-lactonase